ncbi:hypothetical protein WH221_18270 [Chryseobacterium culicis]|uniref:Lipoprotein n=1 Tax=Chryseobacterium culicis TaxID=680127 RepID=A0A2S9CQ49_CHRCI|nr:hypothetical protein [Chryseobacterium culicis]PRB82621.1 hypothetical protein CQ022_18220 [Chryseobacterium culicis]PRB88996.1 hypothetical protein CQ033_17115 [Chryseobacterium culicis]
MKLHNNKYFLFFYLIILVLLYSCKNLSVEYYYDDRTEKTSNEKVAEDEYFKDIPKEYQKTDNDILLLFNGAAFKGKTIIINNKDSINFKSVSESGCYGVTYKKVNKSVKKIRLSIDGKKDIIIPFINGYDYIDIGDAKKDKWGVGYSKILPSYFCM